MENLEENGKRMLLALENLSDKELEAIGVTDKRNQKKNAHKILKKINLINETLHMMNNLAQQCSSYRQRFDNCIQCGLPFIFNSNNDIYAKDRLTYHMNNVTRDDSFLSRITGPVTPQDIFRVLRKP